MSNNFAPPFTQAATMIIESTGENDAEMNYPLSDGVVSNTGTEIIKQIGRGRNVN